MHSQAGAWEREKSYTSKANLISDKKMIYRDVKKFSGFEKVLVELENDCLRYGVKITKGLLS